MIFPFRRSGRCALAALLAAALVVACGSPPPATIVVEGVVRQPVVGPLAGVVVHVAGTTTTTDAAGGFRVEGVQLPYDVTIGSSSPSPWVSVVEGLVDPAPTLEVAAPLGAAFRAEVTGNIYGGLPLPVGTRAVVCAEGAPIRTFGCAFVAGGEVTYTLDVAWFGGPSAPVHLDFLWMIVDADGFPTSIPSGLRHAITLVHGAAVTFHPAIADVFAVSSEPLSVGVTVAGGGELFLTAVVTHLDDAYGMPVQVGLATPGGFTLAVPQVPIGRHEVLTYARFGDGESAAWAVTDQPAAGVDVLVPAPPQLLGPADGATVTAATEFVTIGGPGVARTFSWWPEGGTDGPVVRLTTASERATMPDLSVVGMAWEPGGSYGWSVTAGAHATVEEAAAEAEGAVIWYYTLMGGMIHDADGCLTETEARGVVLTPAP